MKISSTRRGKYLRLRFKGEITWKCVEIYNDRRKLRGGNIWKFCGHMLKDGETVRKYVDTMWKCLGIIRKSLDIHANL